MSVLSKLVWRFQALPHLLENPKIITLYFNGASLNAFLALNKPWLHALNIATVLDIGAHTGQFAAAVSAILPNAEIYSFEPLPDCFDKLQKRMANMKNFVGFNIGLGQQTTELELNRSNFTASSSFLKMNDIHKAAFPHTQSSSLFNVKVDTLDSFIEKKLVIVEPLLIKIDVQGYEKYVLKGGEKTVRRATLIIIETSFEELYEGQPLFDDIYSLLKDWGFNYRGTLNQLLHPSNGRILQEDSLFVKS